MSKIKNIFRVIWNSTYFCFERLLRKNIYCKGMCTSRLGNEFTVSNNGEINIGYHFCALKNSRFLARGGVINIGDNVGINTNCTIACHKKITIGNGVELGPNICIYDHDHDFRCKGGLKAGKYKCKEVIIGDNVWIGANTIILKGTKIGENCVVAGGSIVSGVIPDNTIFIQSRSNTINYIESR